MGMSSGGDKKAVQSDINVTPLIDVLLVLLIIFLVVMPVMMKMETLQTPRHIDDKTEMPDQNARMVTIKLVDRGANFKITDNDTKDQFREFELEARLDKILESMTRNGTEKVIFVDFEDDTPWRDVVTTMDRIRSKAADVENHDEIKVALKIQTDEEKKRELEQNGGM